MFVMRFVGLVLVAVVVGGCGGDSAGDGSGDSVGVADTGGSGSPVDTDSASTPPVSTERPQEPAAESDTLARPQSKRDTISVEGEPTSFAATRVSTGLFTTYYPAAEMILDQSSSGEGEGTRFIANFGGTRNDSAFLHIFTPADPNAGPDEARRLLLDKHGIVKSNGWTAEKMTRPRFAWARESYELRKKVGEYFLTGFAAIGEHRGRGFVVVAIHPEEYGDGMGPRVAYILDELRWNDTGAGLGS